MAQMPRQQERSNPYANYDPGMPLDVVLRTGWSGARLESMQMPEPPARANLVNSTGLGSGVSYRQHPPGTATHMGGTGI